MRNRIIRINEDDVPMPDCRTREHVSAWLPTDVKKRIVARAALRGQTVGEYLRAVLTVYVNAMDARDGATK
jgi:hypothetical protein